MVSKTGPSRPRGWLLLVALPFLLILAWWLRDSLAFVQTTHNGVGLFWSDSEVTLNLRLGCPSNGGLTEWGPCWDDAAEDAARKWNATGANFTFRIQSPSQPAAVACDSSATDGITTVVWADTHCGMAWDDNTLAVTGNWFSSTGELADSDVLFNTKHSWSTYSGSHRSYAIDLHRVAIHEFGHVLGLGHPDEHGQFVNAIMNSKADDTDRLQADDIAGIRAIYGGDATGGGDDHGNTRREATDIRLPSDTPGTLEQAGDEDYFRLSVLRSGTVRVETVGFTDTYGTLYTAAGRLLGSDDDTGSGSNFRIVHRVAAGTYYVRVSGYGESTTGSYTLWVGFAVAGFLENPKPNAFKSGVGLISGWVCEARRVEVEISGWRIPVVYGTDRGDTRSQCGDADNGFVTLFNWNHLGNGRHTARLLVDGEEFSRSTFQVTTFGQEFLRGVKETITVPDFPRAGTTTVLEWEESTQNFVIREVR